MTGHKILYLSLEKPLKNFKFGVRGNRKCSGASCKMSTIYAENKIFEYYCVVNTKVAKSRNKISSNCLFDIKNTANTICI